MEQNKKYLTKGMTYGAGIALSMGTYPDFVREGLDASLRDTLQQKQKSVRIMVIIQTITNYNKPFILI